MVATPSDTLTLKSFMSKSAQLSNLIVFNQNQQISHFSQVLRVCTGSVKITRIIYARIFLLFLEKTKQMGSKKKRERERIYLKQARKNKHSPTYIFLRKVYEVLQINVISVCSDVVVYKEIKLVLDPVFENKR